MEANNAPSNLMPSMLDFDVASYEDRWRDDGGQIESHEEETLSPELCYPPYLIANDRGVPVANVAADSS